MEYDLADFAVNYALKKGCSYSEARLEKSETDGFMLKNGVPQIAGFDTTKGIGIRIIYNKTLGFATTNEVEKEKIKEMIERTVKVTKACSKKSKKTALTVEKTNSAKYFVKQKYNLRNIGVAEKLSVLFEIEKKLEETKLSVPGRFLSLSDSLTNKYFVNSEGTKIFSEIPKVNYFYYLTVQQGTNSAQRFWQYGASKGWEILKEWNLPEKMAAEIRILSKNLAEGVKTPHEKIDLVVAPEVVGIIAHESGGHPYESDRILGREAAQAGESFITKDMKGKKIGSPVVNVVDDPALENSFGFYLYDDEGVKARRKFLIKNGIINEFLKNRESSSELGEKSNGSARASSYDREPIVRMSNTFFLPGDYSEEELVKETKKGIFMKNFMEWNIDDKRLNQKYVGAEAYLIENGKITKPVKMPVLEIQTPALYSAIDAVADNVEYHAGTCGKGEPMQGIPVWFGGPSLRIKNVRMK